MILINASKSYNRKSSRSLKIFNSQDILESSVADPDPDPVGSGLYGSPGSGSGSFIHKKTPCYSNFLVIKLSKIQFRPNNFLSLILSVIIIFLSLILSVIGCLYLVRKSKTYLSTK